MKILKRILLIILFAAAAFLLWYVAYCWGVAK